jgi:hypothetical protein
MRESLARLNELCSNSLRETPDDWNAQVDATGWLAHVRRVIAGAHQAASLMARGESVLIHCSDGWDRTAQITALTQMLLDPFARTVRGFAIVVQKEWVSFGHKFGHRLGHCSKDAGNSERSPVFLQFLDAVWQLLQQFPLSFEFTEDLLAFVAEASVSCRFGTFLFNCERERAQHEVESRTVSVWTEALQRKDFVNPFFREQHEALVPSVDPRSVRLWPFYFRTNLRLAPRESLLFGAAAQLNVEKYSSRVRLRWLEHKVEQLRAGAAAPAPAPAVATAPAPSPVAVSRDDEELRALYRQVEDLTAQNTRLIALLMQNRVALNELADSKAADESAEQEEAARNRVESISDLLPPPPPPPGPPPPEDDEENELGDEWEEVDPNAVPAKKA